jgi:hypothetical protein
VSKEPEFPRTLTASEKEAIFFEIIDELQTILRGEGLECRAEGEYLDVWKRSRQSGGVERRRMQMMTRACDDRVGDAVDVVLSLYRIPDALRASLDTRGVGWFDIEAKERSDATSNLGDEVALHLRRHGVRFFRVKAGADS